MKMNSDDSHHSGTHLIDDDHDDVKDDGDGEGDEAIYIDDFDLEVDMFFDTSD